MEELRRLLIKAGDKSKVLVVRELVKDGYISEEQAKEILMRYMVSLNEVGRSTNDPNRLLLFLDIKNVTRKENE